MGKIKKKPAFLIALLTAVLFSASAFSMPPGPGMNMPYRASAVKKTAFGLDTPARKPFAAPSTGTNRCVVILIQLAGETGTKTVGDFYNLLFSKETYPTGSMNDYYQEASYGVLTVTGTVKGWYTAAHPHSWYADNESGQGDYPQNSQGLVEEAIAAADADIDFSQFDTDGDGYVDSLFVVFSGYTNGDDDMIWPHKWELSSAAGGPGEITKDGVKINVYSVEPEKSLFAPYLDIVEIGVFCHEHGHVLGLPDLYDTDVSPAETSQGLGNFCLMSGGAWGADGKHPERPVQPSAWVKCYLGWVTPTLVTDNLYAEQIKGIGDNKAVYKVYADYINKGNAEYFLVCNRQKYGFDSSLFGSGILIFHVDESVPGFDDGAVNDDETHKYVDLEEADGKNELDSKASSGDADDFFSLDTGNTSFSSGTNPSSDNYRGNRIAFEVSNISASAPTMTADIIVKKNEYGVPTVAKSNIFTPNSDGYNDEITFPLLAGTYDIDIFDVNARKVRTLSNTNVWNGKDENGADVETGVYIYRIRQDGAVTNGSVVIAR